MNPAECLLKFCRLIELDDESIKQGESLNGYHLVKNVYAKKLKNISVSSTNKLLKIFGDSLAFRIGDSPSLLILRMAYMATIYRSHLITSLNALIHSC